MRAMLIDDEKPALVHLERLLRADGRLEPVALCMSAREGIERLDRERIDAVFLDIGMPEMNGLEAAEYIQQQHPGTAIVFVTAYSDYAVEAFDLQAIDYLLKPIGSARLQKAIARIVPVIEAAETTEASPTSADPSSDAEPESPGVLMFRRLELYDAQAGKVHPVKWRTAKSQELFAYLLHEGEQWVTRGELIDLLWPNTSGDKAATYLHTSVYQIRKLLKAGKPEMALEYRQESYRLLRGGVDTDAERFERQSESLIGKVKGKTDRAEKTLALWRGGYLEQHDYPWAFSRAEKLQRRRFRLTMELAHEEVANGRADRAVHLLNLLQQEDPFAEDVCRQLISAYESAGDKRSARECYQSFARRLDEELGAEPEPLTRQVYERLEP